MPSMLEHTVKPSMVQLNRRKPTKVLGALVNELAPNEPVNDGGAGVGPLPTTRKITAPYWPLAPS